MIKGLRWIINPGKRAVSCRITFLPKSGPNSYTCTTNYREKLNCQSDYLSPEVMLLELLLGLLKWTSPSCCSWMLSVVPPSSPPHPPLLLSSRSHRTGSPVSPATPDKDIVHEFTIVNPHIIWSMWPLGKMLTWGVGANWRQQLLAFWRISTCSILDSGRN